MASTTSVHPHGMLQLQHSRTVTAACTVHLHAHPCRWTCDFSTAAAMPLGGVHGQGSAGDLPGALPTKLTGGGLPASAIGTTGAGALPVLPGTSAGGLATAPASSHGLPLKKKKKKTKKIGSGMEAADDLQAVSVGGADKSEAELEADMEEAEEAAKDVSRFKAARLLVKAFYICFDFWSGCVGVTVGV